MSNTERIRQQAIETMRNPPEIKTKIHALDALDRLALNPSGWFSDSLLDDLLQARKKVIVNHWPEAVEALEKVRNSMIAFVRVLASKDDSDATQRANEELSHCAQVLNWIDKQPPPGR